MLRSALPQAVRALSTTASSSSAIRVVQSTSHNVHANLAYEDKLFEECVKDRRSALYLWSNDPAVVIGKYQNPWLECNLPYMAANGIALSRRRSGGGAVYHDRGNLNCTFIVPQAIIERKYHLDILAAAINDEWGLSVAVNERHDLVLNGKKISGSAFKMSGKTASHHCTLLLNSQLEPLRQSLRSGLTGAITSRSVASVRSSVMNLANVQPMSVDDMCAVVAEGYQAAYGARCAPELVDPLQQMAAIADSYNEFTTWEWQRGSPAFTFKQSYESPAGPVTILIDVDTKSRITRAATIPAIAAVDEALRHCRFHEHDLLAASKPLLAAHPWLHTLATTIGP
eukprot:m.36888 g.36888  ORF g.36888 m.36888 type:complete len:341 (+) comp5417_c0_seq1:36-1058(+)